MIINYEFVLCIVWDLVWKVIGLLMEFNSLLVIFLMVDRRMDVVCFLLVDDRFVEFIVCFIKRLLIEIVFYKIICKINNLFENDRYCIDGNENYVVY